MAGTTPIYGIPYPESSDLVANYPALGEGLADKLEDKLPTLAATAPTSPSVGQVWIDSSGSPIGKVWDGSAWTIFSGAGAGNFSDTATGTYTDGGIDYKYITFTASGTLTVTQAGFADVLVVGGGAGGGQNAGSGGGAGGHLYVTDAYLPTGSLTVTVGAGGAGANSTSKDGSNGITSRIGTLYGVGGGGGQTQWPDEGRTGGSGGGGSGAGIGGQGNNGGTGYGAGGGGAGANGGNNNGGAGGAGLANSITGSSVTRAGGGGGSIGSGTAGSGGSGGGGAGGVGSGTAGTSGTANTGGGGGGGWLSTAGNGGSGIVIVRVKV